jgi:hypothetical protein
VGQTCNTQFTGAIYTTKPVLKFRGDGELTVIIPPSTSTGATSINDAIYNAITSTIAAIPTLAAAGGGTVSTTLTALQQFIAQINNMLAQTSNLTVPGASATTYETVHMTAYGSRRFFVSQR